MRGSRLRYHTKKHTLNVIVCDFVGDPDLIFVLVAAWLHENQPDICTLEEGRNKGYPSPGQNSSISTANW